MLEIKIPARQTVSVPVKLFHKVRLVSRSEPPHFPPYTSSSLLVSHHLATRSSPRSISSSWSFSELFTNSHWSDLMVHKGKIFSMWELERFFISKEILCYLKQPFFGKMRNIGCQICIYTVLSRRADINVLLHIIRY